MSQNTDRRTGSVAVEMAANGVSDDTVQQVFEQERQIEAERLKTQRTETLIQVLTENFERILSFFEQLLDTIVADRQSG